MQLKQTPSQTVGPFFAYSLTPQQYGYPHTAVAGNVLFHPDAGGERIRITGRVFDGEGTPIDDALIEIWQADAGGHYATADDAKNAVNSCRGFGRCGTGANPEARFTFETIKPGAIDSQQAPHLNLIVSMRGMLSHVFTRMYFPEETAANERDPVLSKVPPDRRATLVAVRESSQAGVVYRFDIYMQGDKETVFFDV